ncbi:hypothetical protein [Paenibacillus wynnii]|uniref:hypothetical protein n=1 Tax=Paenibacillus wynnii TaxID=268407 RepID=UPI00278F25D2|nr:hypothetical protein [Paenibacillus wynnii]MDQ0192386.1 hypothetical protein [Paenibacillus wynnii]
MAKITHEEGQRERKKHLPLFLFYKNGCNNAYEESFAPTQNLKMMLTKRVLPTAKLIDDAYEESFAYGKTYRRS